MLCSLLVDGGAVRSAGAGVCDEGRGVVGEVERWRMVA